MTINFLDRAVNSNISTGSVSRQINKRIRENRKTKGESRVSNFTGHRHYSFGQCDKRNGPLRFGIFDRLSPRLGVEIESYRNNGRKSSDVRNVGHVFQRYTVVLVPNNFFRSKIGLLADRPFLLLYFCMRNEKYSFFLLVQPRFWPRVDSFILVRRSKC